MMEGGFNLRKFCTNSTLLQLKIEASADQTFITTSTGEADETYSSSTLCPSQNTQPGEWKVLGIQWHITTDQFVIKQEDIPLLRECLTLRKGSSPSWERSMILWGFHLQLSSISRSSCRKCVKQSWVGISRWLENYSRNGVIYHPVHESQPFSTARCYFNGDGDQDASYTLLFPLWVLRFLTQGLHCSAFSDRNFWGMLLKICCLQNPSRPTESSDDSQIWIALGTTPIKAISSVNLCTGRGIDIDGASLLHRLNGGTILNPRSGEKLEATSTKSCLWDKGIGPSQPLGSLLWSDNPADLPSRGLTPGELTASPLWRNGPDWLKESELSCGDLEVQMPEECKTEMLISKAEASHGLLAMTTIGQLMKCQDFSLFRWLITVTSFISKFCHILLSHLCPEASTVTRDDQTSARVLWLVESEQSLVKDKNFRLWQIQFDLFQDDDRIWHCGGRIQNAFVLLAGHAMTTLLVKQAHERVMHSVVKAALTKLDSILDLEG